MGITNDQFSLGGKKSLNALGKGEVFVGDLTSGVMRGKAQAEAFVDVENLGMMVEFFGFKGQTHDKTHRRAEGAERNLFDKSILDELPSR